MRFRPEIDTSGPPAKEVETEDSSNIEEQSTFRWRWRQRQKQLRRERRRQRRRQEERRKLQELRLSSQLGSQDLFSVAPSGGPRWRQNRRIDRPSHYGNPDIYFPPHHSAAAYPNLSSTTRQKRKKNFSKPFISSFREQSLPHQPYQHSEQQETENTSVEKVKHESSVIASNPSRPVSIPVKTSKSKEKLNKPGEELLPKPAALTFEYSSSSRPPKIASSSDEEHIARPSITHILFDETETKQPHTTNSHFDSFFVTTFSSSDDFYGNDIASSNSDFYGDSSSSTKAVSNSEANNNVIKHPVRLVPSGTKQKTRNRFVKPKQPPRLRLYASHSYQQPPLHPHYGGTIRVQQQHHPTVTQLIPSVESSGSRRRVDHGRSVDGGSSDTSVNGGNSFFRSLLGVPSYCLAGIEGDLESKCVLTPVCWLSGGVPHKGCNSMLYTCCVDAALSRKVR